MALLDRVKERVETDLGDVELQAMIDEVVAEIDKRYGANAEITKHLGEDRELDGDRKFLTLWRPIDTGQTIAVVEIDAGDAETLLAADDYRVLDGGQTLERLVSGANGRTYWQRLVKITYTPVSDLAQRDEATIKVVQLDVQYRGLSGERAGDWQASYPDAALEREKFITSLAPRRGLAMA